jgi:hypothetical protein
VAGETSLTSANDLRYSVYIAPRVLQEARPLNVSWPLFRSEGSHPALGVTFPIQDDPGPASAGAESIGFNNTQLTTSTSSTATYGIVGQMATVTDQLMVHSIVDAVPHFAAVLGRSVADKIELDHAANYGNFSNAVGSTGTDFTVIQFNTAQSGLLVREAVGQIHCVLHPQQLLDLQAGSGNTPGGILTALSSGSNYYANPNADLDIMNLQNLMGMQGTLLGIGIFVTTNVPSANAAADRAGAMFVSDALGRAEGWMPRVEYWRDISLPGMEIVASAEFGTVEIRDAWGTSIITDHE